MSVAFILSYSDFINQTGITRRKTFPSVKFSVYRDNLTWSCTEMYCIFCTKFLDIIICFEVYVMWSPHFVLAFPELVRIILARLKTIIACIFGKFRERGGNCTDYFYSVRLVTLRLKYFFSSLLPSHPSVIGKQSPTALDFIFLITHFLKFWMTIDVNVA